MKLIYTREEIPTKISSSIFLASSTLRPGDPKKNRSWRKDAVKILLKIGYAGIEFGLWAKSDKVVFGASSSSKKVCYLKLVAKKINIPTAENLEKTMKLALLLIEKKND